MKQLLCVCVHRQMANAAVNRNARNDKCTAPDLDGPQLVRAWSMSRLSAPTPALLPFSGYVQKLDKSPKWKQLMGDVGVPLNILHYDRLSFIKG